MKSNWRTWGFAEMKSSLYSIPKVVKRAKEEFKITTGRNTNEGKPIKDIDKAMRTQIERALKREKNSDGISYWKAAHRDEAHRPDTDKKCTHFLEPPVVAWLLYDILGDYFCSQSDSDEIRAGLIRRKEYIQKAQYYQNAEIAFWENDPSEEYDADAIPPAEFRLTKFDGDRVYRHMIEKIFEQFYSPFDFEGYAKDSEASKAYDVLSPDPALLPSVERFDDLANYYEKKGENGGTT